MERQAGQLAEIAETAGLELSYILVSEIHPQTLPAGKCAEELEQFRRRKVREFIGPGVPIYADIDGNAERALDFSGINVLIIEDGWQVYRMTPPGATASPQIGINPFISRWLPEQAE